VFSRGAQIHPRGHEHGQPEYGAAVLPTFYTESPDLAAVVSVWDRLPEDVRADILAMVKTATVGG
jgi:hypothetical protein